MLLNKRAKKALWERQERYRTLIEHIGDAVFVTTPEGCFIEVNPAAYKLTGYQQNELLRMGIVDILPSERNNRALLFDSLIQQGRVFGETKIRVKDGRCVPVEINANILPGGNYLGIVRDITDRKKTEAQIISSKAMYKELFNHISSGVAVYQAGTDRWHQEK